MSREKTLTEALQKLINRNLRNVRTTTVGKVLKVLANGWLEIDPQISLLSVDLVDGAETEEPLPRLVRVPVGYYKAGGFIMTLPTSVGDEGILIFSDRSLDLWKTTRKKSAPNSSRLHEISDAIFLPFPTSVPGAITFDPNHMVMGKEDGTAVIKISKSDGNILLKSPVEITCEAPLVTVKSELTTMSGALEVTGTVTGADFIPTDGSPAYLGHRHSGVQPGGSDTGNIS